MPFTGGTLKFVPAASNAVSLDQTGQLLINGVCTLTSATVNLSGDCALPIQDFNTRRARRRTCDILNLNIGPLNLNILGLIVSLPEGLILVSTSHAAHRRPFSQHATTVSCVYHKLCGLHSECSAMTIMNAGSAT